VPLNLLPLGIIELDEFNLFGGEGGGVQPQIADLFNPSVIGVIDAAIPGK
jgi:hypothetical protein